MPFCNIFISHDGDVPRGADTKQKRQSSIWTLISIKEDQQTFRTIDIKINLNLGGIPNNTTETNFQGKIWSHTCTDLWAIFSFSSPSKIYKKKREKTWNLPYKMHQCTKLVVLKYSHKTSLILVGRHFNPKCTGKPQHLPLISEYFMINSTGIWPTLDCWKQLYPKSPHRVPHSGCSFSALP